MVECDPNYSSYYVIAYDRLLWPDMYGIDIPHASPTVEYYIGASLFDLLGNEESETPSEFMNTINLSQINWRLQSVLVNNYDELKFAGYIKALNSYGFEQYPFSEGVSTDIHTRIGTKSVDGVSYTIAVDLNDTNLKYKAATESSTLYPAP